MIFEDFTETHSHILPGIDDGAKDVKTSLKMIEMLYLQGAKRIIATPHYYSDEISLDDFVAKRNSAFAALQSHLPKDTAKIVPAAEVYISGYLFSNDDLSPLCFGKSKYMMLEHPFSCSFSKKDLSRIESLICDYGVHPILVHIERYKALMSNANLVDNLIDMGCLMQANISSFATAHRGVKKKLFKYLDSGKIHLIGSDCHNLDTRAPKYNEGATAIIEKCSKSTFQNLLTNSNLL